MMPALHDALAACVDSLPESFLSAHARLFEPDLLARLAYRLWSLHREGLPTSHPPPHLDIECTPPLADAFTPFQAPLRALEQGGDSPEVARRLTDALVGVGCAGLLLLLGQRRTPASLDDARALPPRRETLLAAADRSYRARDALSVAARALAKHGHRYPGSFWARAVGPTARQNQAARAVVERILDGAAWWNVFAHCQHGTVFEARLPSGHGARWAQRGTEFIGFLEPFDPGLRAGE
jgi:hypothetical protein